MPHLHEMFGFQLRIASDNILYVPLHSRLSTEIKDYSLKSYPYKRNFEKVCIQECYPNSKKDIVVSREELGKGLIADFY